MLEAPVQAGLAVASGEFKPRTAFTRLAGIEHRFEVFVRTTFYDGLRTAANDGPVPGNRRTRTARWP